MNDQSERGPDDGIESSIRGGDEGALLWVDALLWSASKQASCLTLLFAALLRGAAAFGKP